MSLAPRGKSISLGITSITLALLGLLLAVVISPFAGFALCVAAFCLAIASLAMSGRHRILGITAATLSIICAILGVFSKADDPATPVAPPNFKLGWSEEEAAPVGTEADLGSLRTTINSVAIDDAPATTTIEPDPVCITINVTTDTTQFESWMFNQGKPMITFYYYSPSGDQYPEQLELRDQHSHRNNALDTTTPTTTGNVSFIVPRANAEAGIVTAEIAGTAYRTYLALN